MLLDLLGVLLIIVGLVSAFARGRSIAGAGGPYPTLGEPAGPRRSPDAR
jgi:hypothetical protein